MSMTHREALAVAMDAFEDAIQNGKTEFEATAEEIRAYIEASGLVLVPKEPIGFIADRVPGLLKEGLQGSVFVTSTRGPREIPIYAAAPDPFAEE